MDAREKFERLVAEFVKPALRGRGFRTRGTTFFRLQDSNWGLVQLQRHSMSSAEKVLFTVNVAVASARLAGVSAEEWRKKPPAEYSCDLRMRIGHLLPSGHDKWWTIDGNTDVGQMAEEVVGDITSAGLAALEQYITNEALRDLWLSGGGWLTASERARKLLAMVRAIGPAELLPQLERDLETAASPEALAAGRAELEHILLQAGFAPLGQGELAAPTADHPKGDPRFTVRVVQLEDSDG